MSDVSQAGLRLATVADLEAVRAMVRDFCRDEMPVMPLAQDRIEAAVNACQSQQGVMVSCADDGTPVGTLGLVRTHPFWSDKPWLVCLWAYVAHAHRKNAHLKKMLVAAKAAAREQAMILRIEVWNGSQSQGKMALLRRGLDCDAAGAILTMRG